MLSNMRQLKTLFTILTTEEKITDRLNMNLIGPLFRKTVTFAGSSTKSSGHTGTSHTIRSLTSWKIKLYQFRHKSRHIYIKSVTFPPFLLTSPRGHLLLINRAEVRAIATTPDALSLFAEIWRWWWSNLISHRCHQTLRLTGVLGSKAVTHPGTSHDVRRLSSWKIQAFYQCPSILPGSTARLWKWYKYLQKPLQKYITNKQTAQYRSEDKWFYLIGKIWPCCEKG